jgi:magnesium transporter
MLYANTGHSERRRLEPNPHGLAEADGAVWLDLQNPTDEERAEVERATGLRVPAEANLAEIESSSRLLNEGDTIYLSTPMTFRTKDGESHVAPLGFVLSPRHLLTVRFADLPMFDSFAQRFADGAHASSVGAFIGLLEAIVDRLADVLEHVGAELEAISRHIFRGRGGEKNASKVDARLRLTLRTIGRAGERLANLRDSLVGVQRITVYVHDVGAAWIKKDMLQRFSTLRKDINSLMEYDVQLSNKVQFLLDATLGFISIEQNNGIKVLTVVSVVGVPPTLVASIYGMNFKWIPELQWEYGYFYGLGVIVLSAVLPLLWFKKRGWI